MKSLLMNPWFHHVVLLIHICAGLFWLGWMVFIFFLLSPVLKETVPDRIHAVMPRLKSRIRSVVFWLIVLIVLTGTYNVYYNGLYRMDLLINTSYGHRFLIKLGAAGVLFGVYGVAPYLTGQSSDKQSNDPQQDTSPNPTKTVTVILHVIAFVAGLIAALLGISL